MRNKFPTGNLSKNSTAVELKKPGFYYIKAEDNAEPPILPHRKKETRRQNFIYSAERERNNHHETIFTNGSVDGVYTNYELELFLEHGGKIGKIL
jgi:hypothetical protein